MLLGLVCAIVFVGIVWLTIRSNPGRSIDMTPIQSGEAVPSQFSYILFPNGVAIVDQAVLTSHAEVLAEQVNLRTAFGKIPVTFQSFTMDPPSDWREPVEQMQTALLSARGLRTHPPTVSYVDIKRADGGAWVTLHVDRGATTYAWRYLVVNNNVTRREQGELRRED